MELQELLVLVSGWLIFFTIHSLLASIFIKERVARHFPEWVKLYRLTYNLLALIIFIPLYLNMKNHTGMMLWQWQPPIKWIMDMAAVCAVVGFASTLIGYDMQEFLGIRQLRVKNASVHDQGAMHLSFLHRFVRHPWYFLLLVILWTRDMSIAQCISFSLFTLYLYVGAWLEERKLRVYYGDVYAQYMNKVPGIIPLPWRFLSKADTEKLLS